MSNFNSVADVILHQNQGNPLVLSIPTTGHQQVQLGAGPAILTLPNPLALVDTPGTFPGRAASAIPFILRVAGLLQFGRGVEYQIDINQSTSLSPSIASTGLVTAPLGTGLYQDNFLIECECIWDPISTNLRGIQYGWFGSNQITQSSILSGIQPASLAALQFNIGLTILNTNASNQITINEFSAELV